MVNNAPIRCPSALRAEAHRGGTPPTHRGGRSAPTRRLPPGAHARGSSALGLCAAPRAKPGAAGPAEGTGALGAPTGPWGICMYCRCPERQKAYASPIDFIQLKGVFGWDAVPPDPDSTKAVMCRAWFMPMLMPLLQWRQTWCAHTTACQAGAGVVGGARKHAWRCARGRSSRTRVRAWHGATGIWEGRGEG